MIKIVASTRYKGGIRLWVLCGAWALQDYADKHETVMAISRKYSVKPQGALGAVLRVDEEALQTRATLGALKRELIALRLDAMTPNEQGDLLIFETDLDAGDMRYCADLGANRCPQARCIVLSEAEDGCRYVCVSRNRPLRALAKELRESFGGGGGGSDAMIQGSVSATREQLEEFFRQHQ